MCLPAWDGHAATPGIRGASSTRNPLNQGDVSLHDTALSFYYMFYAIFILLKDRLFLAFLFFVNLFLLKGLGPRDKAIKQFKLN